MRKLLFTLLLIPAQVLAEKKWVQPVLEPAVKEYEVQVIDRDRPDAEPHSYGVLVEESQRRTQPLPGYVDDDSDDGDEDDSYSDE